jgi:hypothetical protein
MCYWQVSTNSWKYFTFFIIYFVPLFKLPEFKNILVYRLLKISCFKSGFSSSFFVGYLML